jgi:hypothetical protein
VSELGFKFENESKLYGVCARVVWHDVYVACRYMSLQALVVDYHKLLIAPVDNVAYPDIARTSCVLACARCVRCVLTVNTGSPPSTPPPGYVHAHSHAYTVYETPPPPPPP